MNSPANLVPSGSLNLSAHLKLPSSTLGNVLVTNHLFAYLFISLSWFKSGTFPIGFYSRFVFSLRLYLKMVEFFEGLGLAGGSGWVRRVWFTSGLSHSLNFIKSSARTFITCCSHHHRYNCSAMLPSTP